MAVRDSVPTYRLRPTALKEYLKQLFRQEIAVNTSEDGKTFYWFTIPRKLSQGERDYIYDGLRYKKDEDTDLWE
ncbi:uncharacterized protein F4822DRAFT_324285 [Hypoxylon trugodes]|uniref:uncharacterized protein n=1 Tax=Hypoxylon trugodes TaxID=326681 RepID=UPI00219E65BE|nr:uncharacterized protein F4822DRAFT_324285 [Hypoxylon trugodes]KAI1386687.1 hypothetical protein F4822DRAFT_324285 [Hypoxylon trugodes]